MHVPYIPGVIHESRGIDHEDHRRTLITAFNGDLGGFVVFGRRFWGFVARQVKFAELKEDAVLGGHYHNYPELFYFQEGEGTFILRDIRGRYPDEEHHMVKHDRLFIPRGIAHKALIKAGSVLVGCTKQPYVSPKHNDHKVEF